MTRDFLFMKSGLIKQIAQDSGLLSSQLTSIIRTAPLRYKVYRVPKRTSGMRELAQPAKEVKWIQRWLIAKMRGELPIHSSVSAYEPGASIVKNARQHLNSRFLLKMDFKDFFPSIGQDDVFSHVTGNVLSFTEADASLVCQVCLWAKDRAFPLRLCIGAPSSPLISNSIMYEFDEIVSKSAGELGVSYTRYADDLTFSSSSEGVLQALQEIVGFALKKISYPKVEINPLKTVHCSRAGRRVVTGVVITPDGRLSTGRGRKRLIRAMAHRFSLGLLSDQDKRRLNGLISFVDSVEPGFARKANRWKLGRPDSE